MKILLLIFIVGINTYSYSQVELDLYFRDECKNEIKKLEFELIDSSGQFLDLNRNKPVLDSIGTYYVYCSMEMNNRADATLIGDKLKILKKGVFTDTIVIPKIRFVTPNTLHSREWDYYNCSQLCDGIETDFYSNGNKRLEGKFVNGKPVYIKSFRKSGILELEELYKTGEFQPYKENEFDEKGDLLEYRTRKKYRKKIVIKTFDKNDNLIDKEIQKF